MPDFSFSFLILAPFLDETDKPVAPASVRNLEGAFEKLQPTLYLPLPEDLALERGINLRFQSLKDFRPREIRARIPWLKEETTQKEGSSPQGGLEALLSKVELPGEEKKTEAPNLVRAIYENENFRRLEATWRGLQLFLSGGLPEGIAALLVPISTKNFQETLEDLRSRLASQPPSIILIDFEFHATPYHFEILKKVARLAEDLLCPAVVWVGPGFLHLKDWKDIEGLPYLPHHLEDPSWAPWQALKGQEAGNWMVMILNRVVLRHPYGRKCSSSTPFEEREPLWGAPIWPLALILKESLVRSGWPFQLTAQEGVRLKGLELEIEFPEKRFSQFLKAGLYPLAASPYTGEVFFPELKTLQGTSLAFQLLLSRLSHFLIFLYSKKGTTWPAEEIASRLHRELERLWEEHGGYQPEVLHVKTQESTEGLLVTLEVKPPKALFPLREPVSFRFVWS